MVINITRRGDNVLETIKSLILDFQEASLETGIPRRLGIETVKGKATVCIGVRRSGKSTYMFQIIKRLTESGIPRENILYLNFFDDRIHSLQQDGLGLIVEAYYSLFPEKKNTEKIYCFFDEIQAIPNWESFIDRLMRTEKCEVYLTGSSARMLSREIATQMRGRALAWEMFPFSFIEFLDYKQVDVSGALSTQRRLIVQKAFGEYFETGGFPEILGLEPNLRIKTHQEYFNTILFRDLVERHDISHPKALKDLAYRLLDNIASLYSINGLTAFLSSLGYKAPKSSVGDYLEWFEDAFFLFTVRIFDASFARRNTNPKKIYCVDHAMVSSVSSGILVNSGHLLENMVFASLRRVYPEIFYYRTRTGREVDFIVPSRGKERMLVQASESLAQPQTRKREIEALTEAMAELGVDSGIIVTLGENERVETENGTIEILPAWKFLMDM